MNVQNTIYLFLYICSLSYFTYRAGALFAQRGKKGVEAESIRNLRKAASFFMLTWAGLYLIYVPEMVNKIAGTPSKTWDDICIIVNICMGFSSIAWLSNSLLQHKFRVRLCYEISIAVMLLMTVAYLLVPAQMPAIEWSLCAVATGFLVFYYTRGYIHYNKVLKDEYSDLSGRTLKWTWIAIGGFILQAGAYAVDVLFYNFWTSSAYILFSVLNISLIYYCTIKTLPVEHIYDEDNQNETIPEQERDYDLENIEKRLQSHCIDAKLYLDPTLTRDALCYAIGINRNQLAGYFKKKQTCYYQYINTLRIQYACELIKADPRQSMKEISAQAAFSNDRTFRSAFHDVMGLSPSEYKIKLQ